MYRARRGWVLVLLAVLAVSGIAAGCGGGDGSSSASSADTTSASTEDGGGSAEGGGGVAAAEELVAQYEPGQAFDIEPLGEKPPAGITVAEVNCNVPNCNPESLKEAAKALGWKWEPFTFDVAKGPQDFVRQFEAAVAAKPDYISVTLTFGDELAKPSLAKAEAAGIPVIGVASSELEAGYAGIVQAPLTQALSMGEATAALAITEVGPGAHVAIATDPSLPLLAPTQEGMETQLKENGEGATAESFELGVASPPEQNAAATVNFLQRHQDVNVLTYTASQLATGAYEQLQASGVLDRVQIFIPYVSPADLSAIKDGSVTAGIAGEQNYGWRVADMMARLSVGEEIADKEPVGQFRVIQSENATEDQLDPPEYQSVYEQAWQVGG